MSNRLLINIENAIEWLREEEKEKIFYKGVVRFLEEAASILRPAVESLRGKDIHQTDQIVDEDSILVTLNDLIDHIDYITNKDGMQIMSILQKIRLRLDLARQTIRLESVVIPEIRFDLQKVLENVDSALQEDSENINLKTASVRLRGTMNDLSNV
ncbi:uncharacterized protein LOC114520478 [Dendronephthya gigantea]|uniref:uncharacterized protein LOC114520478 n=1 Tax=Dendronephthya gigantea TaxID=151771 RepID=UPI0010697E57|nr:uncharacterized protein LOC114520478 [Dendronephthya gigantea]XP_028396558.1 uncharacterized protein LOC114520478 [Dendronephthya gigantea]